MTFYVSLLDFYVPISLILTPPSVMQFHLSYELLGMKVIILFFVALEVLILNLSTGLRARFIDLPERTHKRQWQKKSSN